LKRRILKGCGGDSAQNFIRTSGERGFGRWQNFISVGGRNFTSAYVGQNFIKIGSGLNFISADRARNFNFINAARNFTLALAAICILSGCDGGSDGQDREQSARSEQNSAQSSTQNSIQSSVPQGFESKQKSDLNSTIDELANDAKVLGEALQNLQKKAPEALNDFAARNADRTKDLLKQGEAAAREAGKNLDKMGQSLQGIIKDANESLGKVLEGFGVQPRQEPRGGRSQERDDNSDPEEAAGRQSFRI
jgi:hypothetical protein